MFIFLKYRSTILQILFAAFLVFLFIQLSENLSTNLNERGLAFGLDFLTSTAGFEISQSLIPYEPSDSYLKVYFVALLNTLVLSFFGVLFCTVAGFLFGIGGFSKNYLVALISRWYVEIFRNVPLLLQILFWYFVFLSTAPSVRSSYEFLGSYFNNRGLFIPSVLVHSGFGIFLLVSLSCLLLFAVTAIFFWRFKEILRLGKLFKWFCLIFLLFSVLWALVDFPFALSIPNQTRFSIKGGWNLSPEFMAMLMGLGIYTGAFIAEVVRSGINSIHKGQKEAADSLGLKPLQVTRFVIVPQALIAILPSLLNQYLNLIKNSSLATFIGYPEIMSLFAGISLSQSGRAVEIIGITLLTYLMINLFVTFLINRYNTYVVQKLKK